MFEKEAKKHKEEFITTYINLGGGLKVADMIGAQKEQSYQEGAEFGYNKANEWHYVKDGDLPIEDLRQRTRGYYLTASKYKWHKWFIFDVAYFTGVIFIKGGAILDSIIAWREIIPPKELEK